LLPATWQRSPAHLLVALAQLCHVAKVYVRNPPIPHLQHAVPQQGEAALAKSSEGTWAAGGPLMPSDWFWGARQHMAGWSCRLQDGSQGSREGRDHAQWACCCSTEHHCSGTQLAQCEPAAAAPSTTVVGRTLKHTGRGGPVAH